MIRFTRNLSTLQASLMRRRNAAELSGQLGKAEKELSTGKKSDIFKSLGPRSAQALDARALIARNDGFLQSNTQLQHRLDVTADVLMNIRHEAHSVLALAIPNIGAPTQTAGELQMAARTALDGIIGKFNTEFQGFALFGGVKNAEAPLQAWGQPDAATGISPQSVLNDIVGSGPLSAGDAAAKIAQLDDVYGNSNPAQPSHNFDSTFYNGSATAGPRLTGLIDQSQSINYGIQANDPAFTGILKGLSMLAITDVSLISDPDAYAAWVGAAVGSLSQGIAAASDTEARLGGQQAKVAETITSQQMRRDIYSRQIGELENVDPYEVASRISLLDANLQATYAVSARLANLSFLNFMR